ncbi:unnamed protein product [Closterium sp. Yama58-4]|nr:unnamed protein product [Closterium sp. Yama58-4]
MAARVPATHVIGVLLIVLLLRPECSQAQESIKGVALIRGASGELAPQSAKIAAATSSQTNTFDPAVADVVTAEAAAAAKRSRAPLRYSRKEVISSFNKAAHLLRLSANSLSQSSPHFTRLFTAMQAFRNAVALVEMGKRKYNLAEPQMLNGILIAKQEIPKIEPAQLARELGRQLTQPESQARNYAVSALRVAQNGLTSFEVQKNTKRQQELRDQQLQRVQKEKQQQQQQQQQKQQGVQGQVSVGSRRLLATGEPLTSRFEPRRSRIVSPRRTQLATRAAVDTSPPSTGLRGSSSSNRRPRSIPTGGNGAAISANGSATRFAPGAAQQQPQKRPLERSKDRIFEEDPAEEAAAARRAIGAPLYDAQGLAKFYSKRPLEVVGRALRVTTALGSVAVSVLIDRQRGQLDANMPRRASQLRRALTSLGPTFVKLGQALSTRPDLCPPAYLDELALLQDALPTFPDAEAFACIEGELGRPMEAMFESISPSPIAAASLGQVYKARLIGGTEVAVKVQRPGITTAIGLDFLLIRGLCSLIDKYVDSLTTSSVALLDEFADRVYQELNYVQEARNARRFRQLYGNQNGVYVPQIVWRNTSCRVLCMEWVDGVKLSDAASMRQNNLDVIDLVDIGIQCSLRQLLEFGYFHADPHPGNLLAMSDGRLAFLDFGMMSETPPRARFAIIGHVVHLVNRDYEAMARDYYELDFLDPSVDVAPIVPALRGFFDDVLQATVSELNFKTIVDGLGAVLYQYPFNVPAYYALILRSLTVLEGLALYSDPNFKVLAAAYPYMAKRLLTDPNPYLRDALIELLFKDGVFRWSRLENLLAQGQKDRDYKTTDALQPLMALILGPEGKPLRTLVVAEGVRVAEALLVAGAVDGALEVLPDAVLRCWALLRSSDGFDPASLLPLVDVLQQEEVREMGSDFATGLLQRLAARSLQLLLQPPPSSQPAAPAPAL